MDNLNQHIDLISKYLSEQINSDEELLLLNWIKQDKKNEQFFNEIKKSWDLTVENYDAEVSSINLDEEWVYQKSKIADIKVIPIKNKKINLPVWLKIAASVVILISIGIGLFNIFSNDSVTLSAKNNIIEKELSDGSYISITFNSSISFKKDYNKKQRKIKLEGEAFFNVAPNKSKPFVVKADELLVEAVGTSFNIKNLNSLNYIDVTVESGIVKLYSSKSSGKEIFIEAGESARFYRKTAEIEKLDKPAINYLSWKTKILKFNSASLEEIINTINYSYNSNIIFTNDQLKHCIFTISFENQSLDAVLNVLEKLEIKTVKKDNAIEIIGKGCENDNNN